MPWWTRPSRCRRSARPVSVSSSTVPCSSTPARTLCSTYSRLRASSTTESMPRGWRRCDSIRPAGPAPTIPTCVRIRLTLCLIRCEAAVFRTRSSRCRPGGPRADDERTPARGPALPRRWRPPRALLGLLDLGLDVGLFAAALARRVALVDVEVAEAVVPAALVVGPLGVQGLVVLLGVGHAGGLPGAGRARHAIVRDDAHLLPLPDPALAEA